MAWSSRAEGEDAGVRFQRGTIGALAVAIAIGCIVAGRPMNGVIAAVGLWFGAGWIIDGAVRQKQDAAAAEATAPAAPALPELVPILTRLEAARAAMMVDVERRLRTRLPVALALGSVPWLWSQFGRSPDDPLFLGVYLSVAAGAGWAWAVGTRTGDYSKRYKQDVVGALAARLGDLRYRPAIAPDPVLLREQRLFAPFTALRAEDEIVGTYHGVPLSIIELTLTYRRKRTTQTVFDGLFVRIALPRTLSGTTAIVADIGVLTALRDLMSARGGARARVEDPEFEAAYQVYTTDQVSARALLTPVFMARFRSLGARTGFGAPLALAQGNDLAVALPKQGQHDLFEPPRHDQPADSRLALSRLHDDLTAVLAVADAVIDLDQSVRRRAVSTNRGQ